MQALRLFLISLKSPLYSSVIFSRDVALADPVDILGRDVDRPDEGVDQVVDAAHQLAPAAGELLGVAAGLAAHRPPWP